MKIKGTTHEERVIRLDMCTPVQRHIYASAYRLGQRLNQLGYHWRLGGLHFLPVPMGIFFQLVSVPVAVTSRYFFILFLLGCGATICLEDAALRPGLRPVLSNLLTLHQTSETVHFTTNFNKRARMTWG